MIPDSSIIILLTVRFKIPTGNGIGVATVHHNRIGYPIILNYVGVLEKTIFQDTQVEKCLWANLLMA
jgi:hypothetical protein